MSRRHPHSLLAAGRSRRAFTLVELLVATGVLALLLVLVSQLFNSAQAITGLGNKRMDADSQTRAVFDRMAIDFGQMVQRRDVDYFLKDLAHPQPGNDQLAFYSQVPGYFLTSTAPAAQSPISLVAYRVDRDSASATYNKLQRLGYGLVWNGIASTDTPLVYLPLTISDKWPMATDMTADSRYELAGPQVFRLEYYYVLKGQADRDGTIYPSQPSAIPWDARIPNHTAVEGMRDVAAIAVMIAVIDPKSRILVSDSQLAALAGQMNDFSPGVAPSDLEAQWQAAIDSPAVGLPRAAAAAIGLYRRSFWLPSQPTLHH